MCTRFYKVICVICTVDCPNVWWAAYCSSAHIPTLYNPLRTTADYPFLMPLSLPFLQMFADNLTFLVMLMPPMIAAGAVLNVITNSAITKVVPEGDTGTALGLNMASHSVIRTFAPTLGGYLYAWLGYPCFGLLGFIMNGFTTVAVLTVLSNIQLQ